MTYPRLTALSGLRLRYAWVLLLSYGVRLRTTGNLPSSRGRYTSALVVTPSLNLIGTFSSTLISTCLFPPGQDSDIVVLCPRWTHKRCTGRVETGESDARTREQSHVSGTVSANHVKGGMVVWRKSRGGAAYRGADSLRMVLTARLASV